MLFIETVSKWQADSWKRVRSSPGTQYLLNTTGNAGQNRVDSIIEKDGRSTLYYFDNPFDEKDRGNYMVLSMSVAELIVQMDLAPVHNSLTLTTYLNNNPNLATTDIEIGLAYFAYAVADANLSTRSWVTYNESGWDTKTVLVNNTLANLLAQVNS